MTADVYLSETRTFTIDLSRGDDGIADLVNAMQQIGTDLPDHRVTDISYERPNPEMTRVSVTVSVYRD